MKKILAADDSATQREFLKNTLTSAGYDVNVVVDGAAALKEADIDNYDCILLDVVMPGDNGYQICRKLKSGDLTYKIPVIMVTSKGQDSDKYWGKKQGACDYIVKPYTQEELVEKVNEVVYGKNIITGKNQIYKEEPVKQEKSFKPEPMQAPEPAAAPAPEIEKPVVEPPKKKYRSILQRLLGSKSNG